MSSQAKEINVSLRDDKTPLVLVRMTRKQAFFMAQAGINWLLMKAPVRQPLSTTWVIRLAKAREMRAFCYLQ